MTLSESSEMAHGGELSPARRPLRLFRLAGLYSLFFLISFGLGYPILNRYDPSQIPGLSDVKVYSAMTAGKPVTPETHLRFRVLVPAVARPFYLFASSRAGTWNPLAFGLLVADSLFVAGTGLLIVLVGMSLLGDYSISLVAALLYMLNFCVPNMRLSGMVDAGEAFFLLAMFWSLSQKKLWLLPAILALGALTKESFVPFSLAFLLAWWMVVRHMEDSTTYKIVWIAGSWLLGVLAICAAQWYVRGQFVSLIAFAASLHHKHAYGDDFAIVTDHNFWYTFCWLFPTALPKLMGLSKSWTIPTLITTVVVFILDGYYGGGAGTASRALFSVTGPLLALSSASFLLEQQPWKGSPTGV